MTKIKTNLKDKKQVFSLRVKVIKAPLVDTNILNQILLERQRAVVL